MSLEYWVIVDERLAYHKYLASDKTLKSMPVVESSSTKEPDIAIFDQAFAYSDSDDPLTSVTIIEFKKPDNDTKNPINQIGEYIDEIKKGRKKKANGQSFNVTDGTMFRGYVICDLTDKMRTHCMNSGLAPTADNLGYSGYNQMRRAFLFIILMIVFANNSHWYEYVLKVLPGAIIETVSYLFFKQSSETRNRASDFLNRLRNDEQISKSIVIADSINNEELKSLIKAKIALHICGINEVQGLNNFIEKSDSNI